MLARSACLHAVLYGMRNELTNLEMQLSQAIREYNPF